MVWRLTCRVLAVLLMALPLRADPVPLLTDLPKGLQQTLQKRPELFLNDLATIIVGYGQGGEIDRSGIDIFIALQRADARAYHMRLFLRADLDWDGSVSRRELHAVQATSSARQRGRMELAFRRADTDADDQVSNKELRAYAELRAMDRLTGAEAEELYGMLVFDLDDSGTVTLEEAIRAIDLLQSDAT